MFVDKQTASFDRAKGLNVMEEYASKPNPEIEAVLLKRTKMALGESKAIQAAGKTGEIQVVGF